MQCRHHLPRPWDTRHSGARSVAVFTLLPWSGPEPARPPRAARKTLVTSTVRGGTESRASLSGCSGPPTSLLHVLPAGSYTQPPGVFLQAAWPLTPCGSFPPDCKFTCHPECRHLIQLDCGRQAGPPRDRPSPESPLTPTSVQVGSNARGPGWAPQSLPGALVSRRWQEHSPCADVGVPFWPHSDTYVCVSGAVSNTTEAIP